MDNNRQGANSVSIVGRLSTLQSVHYQRFHCIPFKLSFHREIFMNIFIKTHRYGGEFESILQNNLSKLAVVQYQVGGVSVQPVDETTCCCHYVCCDIDLRQFQSCGLGI